MSLLLVLGAGVMGSGIAAQIANRGGDYLLALKGNQHKAGPTHEIRQAQSEALTG